MSSNLKEDILRAAHESQCRDIECTPMKVYRRVLSHTVMNSIDINEAKRDLVYNLNSYLAANNMDASNIISISEEVDSDGYLHTCRLIVYYRK